MNKYTPLGPRILVTPLDVEDESVSEGGIVIVDNIDKSKRQKAMQKVTVVELGAQAYKDFADGTPWCAPGDVVLITRYSHEAEVDPDTGVTYWIINDEDVLMCINKKKETIDVG